MNISLRARILVFIAVNGFSKQWGLFGVLSCPSVYHVKGMKVDITDYVSDRYFITLIQTFNKNNTGSNNKSEQTYGILQGVINRTGIKQAQNKFNRYSKEWKGEKHNNQPKTNLTYNVDFPRSKSLSLD